MTNDTTAFKVLRRLGTVPCVGCNGCPDILELADGNFAVIGEDITSEAANLPAFAGCGPSERMVRIPRHLLVHAKSDIPDRL